ALRPVPVVPHRVEDAAVHGLEAVPDVWERAPDDDAHRIVDVALLHLRLDIDRFDPVVSAGVGRQRRIRHGLLFVSRSDRVLKAPVRPDQSIRPAETVRPGTRRGRVSAEGPGCTPALPPGPGMTRWRTATPIASSTTEGTPRPPRRSASARRRTEGLRCRGSGRRARCG